MKKQFSDPELEVEFFEDAIDCLSISEGDHEEQTTNSTSKDT